MDRTIDVRTGESVAFTYELAGLGSRFLAVFVDTMIQIAALVAGFGLFIWLGVSTSDVLTRAETKAAGKFAGSIFIALVTFAVFLLFAGYFIAFETWWNGRTPGKRLLGIRVVRDGGFPVDLTSALIRNVVRILEAGLGFYAISAVSALLSKENRRLGDFAAGTVVVRDQPDDGAVLRVRADAATSDDPLVRDLGPRERDLVRRYIERRDAIGQRARAALAGRIAGLVRPQLPASFEHLDDDELLGHVAAALR
jgi:uncharacterized RDD family membrane protein YckC